MQPSEPRDHHISLYDAAALAATHRQAAQARGGHGILGGRFDRAIIDEILAQPGCVGLRYYHGTDPSGKPALVLVGVTADNEDLWQGVLAQEAWPCPPFCASDNPLNG